MTITISEVTKHTSIGYHLRILIICDSKELLHDSASSYEGAYTKIIKFLEEYRGT